MIPIPKRKPNFEDMGKDKMAIPLPNLNLNQNASGYAEAAPISANNEVRFGAIMNDANKMSLMTWALIVGGALLWLKLKK